MFPLFATGLVDTGGIFASSVVDTGGKLPLVSLTPVANLPSTLAVLVANLPLIPVVHLDLQISPRIFQKFKMTLMLLSEAWGKMIHEKNQKQKIA